jgi:GTP-binding protein
MAFVDEITIHAKAGDGGNGVERWLHEKFHEFGGPSGGDGGRGGDVYMTGTRDRSILSQYRHDPEFLAERGGDGGGKSMHGKNGDDVIIKVPTGSIITNKETNESFELLNEGEPVKILTGGRGGLGNEHFKSSTNRSPIETTDGKPGQVGDFYIEVRLIADAGLIGLPNAGKTSLLNALTRAGAKTGNYAFTTLEPNLGDLMGYILADIPGLIEGASEGKGLGHKFLRHITRTKFLIHCISLESEDPEKDYDAIRAELGAFDPMLLEKREIIVLTKSDMVTPDVVEKWAKKFSDRSETVIPVTILDDAIVKKFRETLLKFLERVN